MKNDIIDLCKDKYSKFNQSHVWEEIIENGHIEIKKNTFQNISRRNNLLNKKVKKRKPKNSYRRDRMKQKGIMLQIDGRSVVCV